MKKTYPHIRAEERAVILLEHKKQTRARQIAERLGRSASTITLERKRNPKGLSLGDDATYVGEWYRQRRPRCGRAHKLSTDNERYHPVHDWRVYWHGSPQQIAAQRRLMPPHERSQACQP